MDLEEGAAREKVVQEVASSGPGKAWPIMLNITKKYTKVTLDFLITG